jgi:hypothetical protein
MLNSLGVRKLNDIVAFVREPLDPKRLELLQRVIASLPALMSLVDSGKTVTRDSNGSVTVTPKQPEA